MKAPTKCVLCFLALVFQANAVFSASSNLSRAGSWPYGPAMSISALDADHVEYGSGSSLITWDSGFASVTKNHLLPGPIYDMEYLPDWGISFYALGTAGIACSYSLSKLWNTSDTTIVRSVFSDGTYVYAAGHHFFILQLGEYDLSDSTIVGSGNWGFNGYDVTVNGGYAYIADGASGVCILNVSNKQVPLYVANYTGLEAYGVFASGNYLYVAAGASGLVILDVSNPSSPSEVGRCSGSSLAWKVTCKGTLAYVVDKNYGMRIIDVSNSSSPSQRSTVFTLGECLDIDILGTKAYLACGHAGVRIIDISNSFFPSQTSFTDDFCPGAVLDLILQPPPVPSCTSADGIVCYSGGIFQEVSTFGYGNTAWGDIIEAQLNNRGNNVRVSSDQDTVFVADGNAGVRILKFHRDDYDPEYGLYCYDYIYETSYYTTTFSVLDVAARGNYAYVSGEGKTIVLDVSDVGNPQLACEVDVGCRRLVLVGDNCLYGLDYHGPSNCVHVFPISQSGQIVTSADFWPSSSEIRKINDLDVRGPHLYLIGESPIGTYLQDRVAIYNLFDRTLDGYFDFSIRPAEMVFYDMPSGISVRGNYVYAAANLNGLRLLNVGAGGNPLEVGHATSPDQPEFPIAAKSYGNKVLTITQNAGAFLFSNPLELIQIGNLPHVINRGSSLSIGWAVTGASVSNVNIYLCRIDQSPELLANNLTNAGSFTWPCPSNQSEANHYWIRIEDALNPSFYDESDYFAIKAINPPTVTTMVVTEITQTSAKSGGNVTADGGAAVTVRGICWGTSQNPTTGDSHTTDGSGLGSYESLMQGLIPGNEYYVRAYATNSSGTGYGVNREFTAMPPLPPSVTTAPITNIDQTSAWGGGNVTSDRGSPVTDRGVCWSYLPDPTIWDSHTHDGSGTGAFSSYISGLQPSKTYHVRAYATNSNGPGYGADVSFTTAVPSILPPTVTTTSPSSITMTSAKSGGNVTADGGASIIDRGVCWNTSGNPTVADSHAHNGTGLGTFSSDLTGLQPGQAYHVRAFAVNSAGPGYGNEEDFATLNDFAIIAPTPGDNYSRSYTYAISWNKGPSTSAYVKIQLYRGSTFIKNVASSTANDGSYDWKISVTQAVACNYRIKIATTDGKYAAWSGYFCIVKPTITITAPTAGLVWSRGTTQLITWNKQWDQGALVNIQLFKGTTKVRDIYLGTPNSGSYSWDIPTNLTSGTNYKVKIVTADKVVSATTAKFTIN